MTPASVESRPGARRRWWGLVALIFIVQLGLIFWLGNTAPIGPRPAAPALTFWLAGSAYTNLLALNDPTLFALPRRQGSARLEPPRTPRPKSPSFQWPELTNSLLLAVDQLGSAFSGFIKTNRFNLLRLPATPDPTLTRPYPPPLDLMEEQPTLRLEADLAQRRLMTPLTLRSWTNADILSDSVIRMAVDSEGRPVSPTLLSPRPYSEADYYALEQARAARFEPVRRNPANPAPNSAADLSWGRMVFHWHTLPPPPANTPEESP